MDVILPLLSAPHIALQVQPLRARGCTRAQSDLPAQEAAAAVVAASLTSEADEEKSAALRTLMLRSDALLPLTWMLNHDGANVRKHAQRCECRRVLHPSAALRATLMLPCTARVFETLLDGDGDLLVPMIERGA